MSAANISDFEFVSSEYVNEDENPFVVDSFEGTEELGRPFRFEISVSSKNKKILIQKILNGYAKLIINGKSSNTSLLYNGVIAEVEVLEEKEEKVSYKFILVPEIWRLSLVKSTRFYAKKDQSILDVIKCAFDCGFEKNSNSIKTIINFDLLDKSCYTSVDATAPAGSEDQSKRFRFTHRDYVLQYEESYFDFIHRWMEKEGIYYFIKSRDDFFVDINFVDSIYKIPRETISVDDSKKFTQKIKSLPRLINLRDYNREKASAALQASAVVDKNSVGNIDIFGENFRNEDEGKWYAKVCADILKSEAYSYNRSRSLIGVKSGFFAKLNRYDEEYLVTKVNHYGFEKNSTSQNNEATDYDKHNYECDFESIYYLPHDAQEFRCQKITPKPFISGNLIAFICGVYALNKVDYIKSEEKKDENKYNKKDIETEEENAERIAKENADYAEYVENNLDKDKAINSIDSEGFYSVEFKSVDIIDTSSGEICKSIKMRLATPYAGFDHGMHFPLIKGTEVLISFTNGDPDLPVIFSAINNSLSPSISTEKNYQDNIIQTKTGNKLILSDSDENRGIYLAVPSLDNKAHYDSVQSFSPSNDPKTSSWDEVARGIKRSNFLGNSFSFKAGASTSISAGLSSSADLSSSFKLSAGVSNSINLGSIGINWKPNIPGVGNLTKRWSMSIGDGGKSREFGDDKKSIETNKEFHIKTGAIDNTFDKSKLSVEEIALKTLLSAAIAGNILESYFLQIDPDADKAEKIKKIEVDFKSAIDICNGNYSAAEKAAKSLKDESQRSIALYAAINDCRLCKIKAQEKRKEKIDKIDDSYKIDNNWRDRLDSNLVRMGVHAGANAALIAALEVYSRKLDKHQESVKKHKSSMLMNNKKIRISQNLLSDDFDGLDDYVVVDADGDEIANEDGVTNNIFMNSKKILISHSHDKEAHIAGLNLDKDDVILLSKSDDKSSIITMTGKDKSITIENDVSKITMTGKDKSITIANDTFNIDLNGDRLIIGGINGGSTIRIDKNEIFFNSEKVNINDGTGVFKKDEADFLLGIVKIFK